MKIKSGISRAGAIIAMLCLTTSAWGACNTEGGETGASNVFELSGQGNLSCRDLNMYDVDSFTANPSTSGGNGIQWTSTEEADAVVVEPSNGGRCVYIYPDKAMSGDKLTPGSNKSVSDVLVCTDNKDGITVAVATVSADTGSVTEDDDPTTLTTSGSVTITDPDVGEALAQPQTGTPGVWGTFSVMADGSWIYEVDNTQEAIQMLNTGETLPDETFTILSLDGTASNTVTVTINGIDEVVVEEEVLPVTTAGNECTGDILIGGSSIFIDPDIAGETVVLAESLDGQTKAACNVTGTGQAYCEDSCVNPSDRGESAACLAASALLGDGQFDLDACKPCDTALDLANPPLHPNDLSENAGKPMEFCWEKTGSVYEGTGDLSDPVDPPQLNGFPRTEGTMLKHTAIRQSEHSITWFNYCYKTSIPVNGRYYWVTTCR